MLSRETGRAIASGDKGAAIGGLFASAISNTLLEPLINALVTPEGLAAMIREGRAREEAPSPDSQSGRTRRDGSKLWERVAFAFFTGPATFEAVFKTEEDEDVVCVMRLNGMHWQLIRLRLPSLDVEPQQKVKDDHNEDEAGGSESPLPPTGSPVVTAIPRTELVPAPSDERPQRRPQEANAWREQEEISPLDDSKNVAIWTTSLEPIQDMLGRRVSPELALWCSENVTKIYIDWKMYIGIDSSEITYRIDKLPAETRNWQLSTNFEASGLWNGSSAIPFIKRLFDRKMLLVRITPNAKSPVAVVFNIEGLKDVADPLMDACHWQSPAAARPKTADQRIKSDTIGAPGGSWLRYREVDALRRQIGSCWTLPEGIEANFGRWSSNYVSKCVRIARYRPSPLRIKAAWIGIRSSARSPRARGERLTTVVHSPYRQGNTPYGATLT